LIWGRRTVAGVITAAAMVLVGSVVGWRLIDHERTYDPATPLAEQCGDVPDDAERITLTGDDGVTLGGALLGPAAAEVGVVLRQGAGQTICDWLPWAADVAASTGARVLLFDRRGRGSSPGEEDLSAEPGDLAAAVDHLRRSGVREVALVGSSMGNSVTFSALDELSPPPCALVAVSPVLTSSDSGGSIEGHATTSLPANLWVAWETGNSDIVAEAEYIRAVAADAAGPQPRLLPVDTDDHSIGLVENHEEVRDFVLDAVSSCRTAAR
jgi:pimeloyl-ACP methyl ester carboxylesterase